MTERSKALNVFYSYAHKDMKLRDELDKHLINLKQQGYIASWYDRDINAGQEWMSEIDKHLSIAQIVLLLVSPDFMNSDYCYSIEMKYALQRYEAGEASVIPVILRHVDWEGAPFSKLQVLPTAGKPIVSAFWHSSDEAFLDVVKGIRRAVLQLTRTSVSGTSRLVVVGAMPESKSLFQKLPTWNVPYRRNLFFTGREDLLKEIYNKLSSNNGIIRPQAISGLGGIGKTHVVVEYAYRHQAKYPFIFWVRATTQDALIADFIILADLLKLPEKSEPNQDNVISAVKQWLETHEDWLLILDDVNDLVMVYSFLPATGNGHVLFTTQAQSVGPIAEVIEVEKMSLEEGALLLLRRARVLMPEASLTEVSRDDWKLAEAIVTELDGLPLALDQAGAYIEEMRCSLSEYLDLYHQHPHRQTLLQRRSSFPPDHSESVAKTWSLSFQRVAQANPAAAELLYLCAFLDPDAIPEEIITKGAPNLGAVLKPVASDPLKLNEAIEALLKFSLIRRNPKTKMLSIHRLVQAVLVDGMDKNTQKRWAKRAVQAVKRALPIANVMTWAQGRRYLPQARACTVLIERYGFTFPEVIQLLNETSFYLRELSLFKEAEVLLKRALAIYENNSKFGPEHPATATRLHRLAMLYFHQRKYDLAEMHLLRSLTVCEQALGKNHLDTADNLSSLARVYTAQRKSGLAEQFFKRAQEIYEMRFGPEHPDVAEDMAENLDQLALLYRGQGKYDLAGELLQRALNIYENVLDKQHPNIINILTSLAKLYNAQGKYELAGYFLQRALTIHENILGPEHPYIANILNNLAEIYITQDKYELAASLLTRALEVCENVLGPEHPQTATSLNSLAYLYMVQNNYKMAEPLQQRALLIRENVFGLEHPQTATSLNNLASLYIAQGKYELAKSLLQRTVGSYKNMFEQGEPDNIIILERYVEILRKVNLIKEAAELDERVKAIYTTLTIQENTS